MALSIPGLTVALIGIFDDIKPVKSSVRFCLHILATTAGLLILPELPQISIGEITLKLDGWGLPFAVFAVVWLINLFNFMDGIDGIAGVEFITVLLSGAILLGLLGNERHSQFLIMACAPTLGFLLWNWPPAKIFMGDGGSGFLGLMLGLGGLYICAQTELTLWAWAILVAVFVVDASWTLIVRIATGQDWLQPHRSHAYQRLALYIGSHTPVTIGVLLINLLWLLPMAWLAMRHPDMAEWVTLGAYLPLLLLCALNKAGTCSIANPIIPIGHKDK